jgi:5'-nucleotidase
MVHGAELVRKLLAAGWPKGTVINVNFPDCHPDQVKGVAATVQGLRDTELLDIDDRMDTRGKAYYWIGIAKRGPNPPKGSDLWAVRSNLISVTPLCLDFTDRGALEDLASVLEEEDN